MYCSPVRLMYCGERELLCIGVPPRIGDHVQVCCPGWSDKEGLVGQRRLCGTPWDDQATVVEL